MSRAGVTLAGHTPQGESILLRPFRFRDQEAYLDARRRDHEWLTPWDPTSPDGDPPQLTFREMVRQHRSRARRLEALAFLVESRGQIVGQINGNSIVWGAARTVSVGYWVTSRAAGRWIAPTAVAIFGDYAFGGLGLHRIELGIRPENTASIAVAHKVRMREEGLRPNFLHIAGAWRDHRVFALTVEDLATDGRGASLRERVEASFRERTTG